MKCEIIVDDWRKRGVADSIYNTELGVELSSGLLHSGTTFKASIRLPNEVTDELLDAHHKHGAYLTVRLIPEDQSKKEREQ